MPHVANLRLAASEVGWVRQRVRFDRCAIVAGAEAQIATAVLFKKFADPHFGAAVVFTASEAAQDWLAGNLDLSASGVDVWR